MLLHYFGVRDRVYNDQFIELTKSDIRELSQLGLIVIV